MRSSPPPVHLFTHNQGTDPSSCIRKPGTMDKALGLKMPQRTTHLKVLLVFTNFPALISPSRETFPSQSTRSHLRPREGCTSLRSSPSLFAPLGSSSDRTSLLTSPDHRHRSRNCDRPGSLSTFTQLLYSKLSGLIHDTTLSKPSMFFSPPSLHLRPSSSFVNLPNLRPWVRNSANGLILSPFISYQTRATFARFQPLPSRLALAKLTGVVRHFVLIVPTQEPSYMLLSWASFNRLPGSRCIVDGVDE